MTKLKEWVEGAGYRLIDLFKRFDKDGSMSISRDEFVKGIRVRMICVSLFPVFSQLEIIHFNFMAFSVTSV
jgi:hypothetical protein